MMDLIETKQQKNSDRHPWELARFEVITFLISRFMPDLTHENLILLDVGCGDTFLLERLSRTYPQAELVGVDTAFDGPTYVFFKKKYADSNISVFRSLDEAGQHYGERKIQVVFLLDVLEHIEEQIHFLKSLQKHPGIDENTRFVITVPAYQALFSMHDVFLKHLRRYNNQNLKQILIQSGFTAEQAGYFFFSLFLVRSLQKLMELIKKPDISKMKGIGGHKKKKIIDSLYKNLLVFDFRVFYKMRKIGINFPGLSNYVLCKKSVL